MARKIIIENILNLIKGIGGNPNKFMGTKTNVSFLGKGPQESLFQGAIDIDGMVQSGFPLRKVIAEAEKAGGYVTSGKLNDLQLQRLQDNLLQLKNAYRPEQVANITDMATGTRNLTQEGLGSLRLQNISEQLAGAEGVEAAETILPTSLLGRIEGRMKNIKDMAAKLKRMQDEQALGWKNPERYGPAEPGSLGAKAIDESIDIYPGLKYFEGPELAEKTHSARATLLRLLDMTPSGTEGAGVTLREVLSPQELKWVLEGGGGAKGDPIALIAKYFGPGVAKNIPSKGTPEVIEEFVKKIMRVKDRKGRGVEDPFFRKDDYDFAEGGLAEILQVPRSGYSKGRSVKSLMGLVNKKFGKGTLKKASDVTASSKHETLAAVTDFERREMIRNKYQGLIDDDLLNKILADNNPQRIAEVLATIDEALVMQNIKGMGPESIIASFKESWKRKPSASGGLAGILEI